MRKSLSTLIDELIVTNIKIFHVVEKIKKKKHAPRDAKKLQDLNKYRLELRSALNPVRNKKSEIFADTPKASRISNGIATLIDELTVTNIKIFHLVDKIQKDEHTREDAKKAQELNVYRSKICNSLNKEFKQKESNIRV